jgi:hypothetical protein
MDRKTARDTIPLNPTSLLNFSIKFLNARSPEQRLMPTTTAAQLVNTPDMIETTERLSRVLQEINLEGNRAQLTT